MHSSEHQTEKHTERDEYQNFKPDPDGEELAERFVAVMTSPKSEIFIWVIVGTLYAVLIYVTWGETTRREMWIDLLGYGIWALVAYLIRLLPFSTEAVEKLFFRRGSSSQIHWYHWLVWLHGADQLRSISHMSITPGALLGYSLLLDAEGIVAGDGGSPVGELEYCKVSIFGDGSPKLHAPRQFCKSRKLQYGGFAELEQAVTDFPRNEYGEIRTVMFREGNLEIYTHDDRIVKIPRAFPQEEIMEVLREKVPDAVERGKKLS